ERHRRVGFRSRVANHELAGLHQALEARGGQTQQEFAEKNRLLAFCHGPLSYLDRAPFTSATKSRAFWVIVAKSRAAISGLPANSPPTPMAQAPALMNCGAVSRLTAPVGMISMCGNGPFRSLKNCGPPMP